MTAAEYWIIVATYFWIGAIVVYVYWHIYAEWALRPSAAVYGRTPKLSLWDSCLVALFWPLLLVCILFLITTHYFDGTSALTGEHFVTLGMVAIAILSALWFAGIL